MSTTYLGFINLEGENRLLCILMPLHPLGVPVLFTVTGTVRGGEDLDKGRVQAQAS